MLVVAGVAVAIDHRVVQARHNANLLTAQKFKREFDQQFKEGASLNAIEVYLASRPVVTERDLSSDNYVRELRIEVVNGRSPFWGCWRVSVGVIVNFVEERLQHAALSSWSVDCLALPRF